MPSRPQETQRAHVAEIDRLIAQEHGWYPRTVNRWRHDPEAPQVKTGKVLTTCFRVGDRATAHQFLRPIRHAIATANPSERHAALQYLNAAHYPALVAGPLKRAA